MTIRATLKCLQIKKYKIFTKFKEAQNSRVSLNNDITKRYSKASIIDIWHFEKKYSFYDVTMSKKRFPMIQLWSEEFEIKIEKTKTKSIVSFSS